MLRARLTASQQSTFASCGALVLRRALAAEFAELEAGFERVLAVRAAPDGGSVSVPGFLDLDPALSGLRSHWVINHLQAELAPGRTLVQSASTGNVHVGDTPWHVDGVGRGGLNVRINCYLDPVGVGSGCLLVVPGSHRFAPHQGVQAGRPIIPLPDRFDPAGGWIGLESEPGDLVVIDRRVIHAALGGGRRRMFNLDLMEG